MDETDAVSVTAQAGSGSDSERGGKVDVKCCWAITGNLIATCKVDLDASVGQVRSRLKSQLKGQPDVAARIDECYMAVEGSQDMWDDDYAKIMRTKAVRDGMKMSENGVCQLCLLFYVQSRSRGRMHSRSRSR